MANEEHLKSLTRSVAEWNAWRLKNPDVRVDLRQANLRSTKLSSANLSIADLSRADLRNADLRDADLRNADLRDADLRDADLRDANLYRADLTRVQFCQADLSNADLATIQALDTNFESATLTGACIRDWNPNSHTNLGKVTCDFIYVGDSIRNSKVVYTDRRPHDPNKTFAPGDLARLVQKSLATVDLIFREGIDWQAFSNSFQGLQIESESEISIQAIERKPDGSFVVRVEVLENADKVKIYRSFQAKYDEELKRLEGTYRKELQAKDREIEIYKRENTNLWELVKLGATRPITLAHAAKEIQDLLEQLSETYPTTTTKEQRTVAAEAIARIESNPTLRQRVINAAKGGALEALKQTPVGKIVAAAIDGWTKPN